MYSEPGEGTTFKIYLPKAEAAPVRNTASSSHSKRILVIEDDQLIRSLAATILRERGYEVLEAPDGRGALELCQELDKPIDLLITDIGAPGMSGEDLMGFFAVKYPDLAIIHMSGFSRQYLHDSHIIPASSLFLGKPFTVQELLGKVQQALESARAKDPE